MVFLKTAPEHIRDERQLDDENNLLNLRAQLQHLMFTSISGPAEMTAEGGANVKDGIGSTRAIGIELPNAATPNAAMTVPVWDFFSRGVVQFTLYWAPGVQQASIQWRWNVRISEIRTDGQPMVDQLLQMTELDTTNGNEDTVRVSRATSMQIANPDQRIGLIQVRMVRDAAHGDDTYTGEIHVVGARTDFIPEVL